MNNLIFPILYIVYFNTFVLLEIYFSSHCIGLVCLVQWKINMQIAGFLVSSVFLKKCSHFTVNLISVAVILKIYLIALRKFLHIHSFLRFFKIMNRCWILSNDHMISFLLLVYMIIYILLLLNQSYFIEVNPTWSCHVHLFWCTARFNMLIFCLVFCIYVHEWD